MPPYRLQTIAEHATISPPARGIYLHFAGIDMFQKTPYCQNIRDVGK